jgi:hypothetical protein
VEVLQLKAGTLQAVEVRRDGAMGLTTPGANQSVVRGPSMRVAVDGQVIWPAASVTKPCADGAL